MERIIHLQEMLEKYGIAESCASCRIEKGGKKEYPISYIEMNELGAAIKKKEER